MDTNARKAIVLGGVHRTHTVNHSADEFVRGKAHINGIEGFWGYAKVRLAKFRGMHAQTFMLHLKETEFRYNLRHRNIGRVILKICREKPLS